MTRHDELIANAVEAFKSQVKKTRGLKFQAGFESWRELSDSELEAAFRNAIVELSVEVQSLRLERDAVSKVALRSVIVDGSTR